MTFTGVIGDGGEYAPDVGVEGVLERLR